MTSWDNFDPRVISADFWRRCGFRRPEPKKFEEAIALGLPAAIVRMPKLTVRSLRAWLANAGATSSIVTSDRPLLGCLVATRGHGLIFADGGQSTPEFRFTVAHEVAHFLQHYLRPREAAHSALGDSILPVLDGERAATATERLSGILRGVPLRTYQHLLDRDRGGSHDNRVGFLESEADFIAMELLAPTAHVIQASSCGDDCYRCLIDEFLLPDHVAKAWCVRVDAKRGQDHFLSSLSALAKNKL